jgi:hypothetical protein
MEHLYLLTIVWVVLQFCGLLVYQRRGDRAVGIGGFLSYACYCLSLPRGWCVVYVGNATMVYYSRDYWIFRCCI